LGNDLVGSEFDIRADQYYEGLTAQQPPGVFSVSSSVLQNVLWGVLQYEDQPNNTLPWYTSDSTLYRNSAGALVFDAASIEWSAGLDSARNTGTNPSGVSTDVQQALINLFADMNVQPGSLMTSGITTATASTDHTAPASHITQLNFATGLIVGTASDVGGVVAGVEVSFNGGQTWHGVNLTQAAQTTSWEYISVEPANVNPLVRAVDDSGNIETAHGPDSAIPASQGQSIYSIAVSPPYSQQAVASFSSTPGWTLVVPMNVNTDGLTDLLSYNSTSGLAKYSIGVSGSSYSQQVITTVSAAAGWTSIVSMNINNDGLSDLLSYNAATGDYAFSVGAAGPPYSQQLVVPAATGGVGWSVIVPMNINGDALTDLLWYNPTTGMTAYSVGTGSGAQYAQSIVATVNSAPGWTVIVPMNLNGDGYTDLLWYNTATGLAVYSVAVPGGVYSQSPVASVNAATGWTAIIPMNINGDSLSDLLSYNVTTGQVVYSTTTNSSGSQQIVLTGSAPSWTSIVPMSVNLDSLTDLLSYK
jgi:hypothetical protein